MEDIPLGPLLKLTKQSPRFESLGGPASIKSSEVSEGDERVH